MAHPLEITNRAESRYDPLWAQNLLKEGWWTAFPLYALTDEAVKNTENFQAFHVPNFAEGGLNYLSKDRSMTMEQLRSGYKRLIRMIKTYYTKDPYANATYTTAQLFERHWSIIQNHDRYNDFPGPLAEYDWITRVDFTGGNDHPPVWDKEEVRELFYAAELGGMKANRTHNEKGYRISSLSSGDRPAKHQNQSGQSSFQNRNQESQSFRSDRQGGRDSQGAGNQGRRSLCIGCGKEHGGKCSVPDDELYLKKTTYGFTSKQGSTRVCFSYNRLCGCVGPVTQGGCKAGGHHLCSVCGSNTHTAQSHGTSVGK